jgi:hypothetical protein
MADAHGLGHISGNLSIGNEVYAREMIETVLNNAI